MSTNRRQFMTFVGGSVGTGLVRRKAGAAGRLPGKAKVICFDAFPILDPRPVFARVESIVPGRGAELANAWRIRQFEYTWLRTLSGRYKDFWKVTEDALIFAARSLRLDLSADNRRQIMDAYLEIKAYPDVAPALHALRKAGIRLGFLSNMTQNMLEAGVRNSKLDGVFEQILSTDRVAAYKPDPRAYQMGMDAFRAKRDDILFAAFAGWDVTGAKWFGYRTFWVNRLNHVGEELGVEADAVGGTLTDLVSFAAS